MYINLFGSFYSLFEFNVDLLVSMLVLFVMGFGDVDVSGL